MSDWYTRGAKTDVIPIDDRGLNYGDGLFETIAIRAGQPRFWSAHYERLLTGCERLGIQAPGQAALRKELESAIAETNVDKDFAVAKIVVTAGVGPRGYQRPEKMYPSVYIRIGQASPVPAQYYRDGIDVILCETRLASQPRLAGIKSLNRIEQVLARSEWRGDAFFEGLMLDTEDRLICGTMSNVFLVSDNSIMTPAVTRCGVSGVMRQHVMAVFAGEHIRCAVRDIERDELFSADEVFLTNSQFGVLPVARCGDQQWSIGPVTRHVMESSA